MARSRRSTWVFFMVLSVAAADASAQSFFSQYLKPEYLVPVSSFPATSGGDLQVRYSQVQIPVLSGGELLIVGEFPRARYFSITAYDDHGSIVGVLNDKDIRPYGSSDNPFTPGGPAGAEDLLYAVSVRMGAPAPPPLLQCATPLDVHENTLDLASRHTAGTFYSEEQSGFSATVPGYGTVAHMDLPANSGGFLFIRSYLRQPSGAESQFDLRTPLVWVRQSSTGCAVQIAPAGEFLPESQWFSLHSVLALDQAFAHVQHEVDLGTSTPHGPDPSSDSTWYGREEYLPGGAAGGYLATIPPVDPTGYASTADALNAQGRVLQLQFRLPQLPCHTSPACGLTGAEELRYWSLTIEDAEGASLGTLTELSLTPDANSYVTMVMSFGTPLPAHVTAENGYSPFVIPPIPFYRLVMRNYLHPTSFTCTVDNVPFRTAEYEPIGGYMGEYAPLVSTPMAATLPLTPQPLVQTGSCQAS